MFSAIINLDVLVLNEVQLAWTGAGAVAGFGVLTWLMRRSHAAIYRDSWYRRDQGYWTRFNRSVGPKSRADPGYRVGLERLIWVSGALLTAFFTVEHLWGPLFSADVFSWNLAGVAAAVTLVAGMVVWSMGLMAGQWSGGPPEWACRLAAFGLVVPVMAVPPVVWVTTIFVSNAAAVDAVESGVVRESRDLHWVESVMFVVSVPALVVVMYLLGVMVSWRVSDWMFAGSRKSGVAGGLVGVASTAGVTIGTLVGLCVGAFIAYAVLAAVVIVAAVYAAIWVMTIIMGMLTLPLVFGSK